MLDSQITAKYVLINPHHVKSLLLGGKRMKTEKKPKTTKMKFMMIIALCACMLIGWSDNSQAAFQFAFQKHMAKQAVYSANGIVASASPLASQVGVDILKKGGNAFDAGIAVALALNSVDGWMCGPAGSAFFLCYDAKTKKVRALDADNLAPYAATPDKFTRKSLQEGLTAMGIPGTLAGYFAIIDKYCTMNFEELVQPALYYLENGFPITKLGNAFLNAFPEVPALYPNLGNLFAPDGKWPAPGELMKNPNLARTYRIIAKEGKDAFYKGSIAKEMVDYMQANGGLWTMKDLADYEVQWKDPIHTTYRGMDVYGCPPPSSSLTWMEMLKIAEGYDLKSMGHNSAKYVHTITEVEKLAHSDSYQFVADPDFVDVPGKQLLSANYAKAQRKRINLKKAAPGRVRYGNPVKWAENPDCAQFRPPLEEKEMTVAASARNSLYHGCTTHVIVVDKAGNCFTFTHTLGTFFGGHDQLGNTGVVGSNSMDWFDLDKNDWSGEKSNLVVTPRKRNRFTLSPGIIFKDGKPYILVGGSAADTTMTGIFQVLLNMIEFGMDPQAAISAPRTIYGDLYHYTCGTRLALDAEIRDTVGKELKAMGHDVVPGNQVYRPIPGMVHAVTIDPETGSYAGGAETRLDGHVSGY